MTPQIHDAGPYARVITLPTDQDRFTVPNQKTPYGPDPAAGPADLILITTITVSTAPGPNPSHVSLQGQSTTTGEFHDLTAAMTTRQALAAVCNKAPAQTREALNEALTRIRHPAAPTDLTAYRTAKAGRK